MISYVRNKYLKRILNDTLKFHQRKETDIVLDVLALPQSGTTDDRFQVGDDLCVKFAMIGSLRRLSRDYLSLLYFSQDLVMMSHSLKLPRSSIIHVFFISRNFFHNQFLKMVQTLE